MSKTAVLAILAALALSPATASAAAPVTLGAGSGPNVAVDAAGTAYVVWNGPEDSSSVSKPVFCRIPRGASACDVGPKQLAIGGTSLSVPYVFATGSRVVVASARYGYPGTTFRATATVTSADRGQTFAAERKVWAYEFSDATAGPGDTISLVAGSALAFKNIPGDGSAGTGRP